MIGVDTNILVRYLTDDDPIQSPVASELLEGYLGQEKSIFINNIVLCELIWVLNGAYSYKKEQVVKTIKVLLSSIEFCFEHHEIVFLALLEFEKSPADFSDILIGMLNNTCYGCPETFSFDKGALKCKFFKNPGK
jgi:predicted nucleic-acid-binding protein